MDLFIRRSWFLQPTNSEALSSTAMLQALDRELASWKNEMDLPSFWYLTSAAEVNVLLDDSLQSWLSQRTQTDLQLDFIASACTSWHAAILNFASSEQQDVLVLQLELNQHRQQDCLDSLGIGIQPEQDGLSVVTGVAVSWLSKVATPHDEAKILECDLLSQPSGLDGLLQLIRLVRRRLITAPDTPVVSFDIHSRWGKQLLKGFSQQVRHWLTSIESDQQHFLSIKPLREMHTYLLSQQHREIWILTLGGGGRIGCLRLTSESNHPQGFIPRAVHRQRLTLDASLRQFQAALAVKEHSTDAFYAMVRSAMSYPQKRFRGHHNQVFHWHPSHSWQQLPQHYGAQYGEA